MICVQSLTFLKEKISGIGYFGIFKGLCITCTFRTFCQLYWNHQDNSFLNKKCYLRVVYKMAFFLYILKKIHICFRKIGRMSQAVQEKRLLITYSICTVLGAVASITTGIAWGHWKLTLDQCVNGKNCSCILYGQYTPSKFLGNKSDRRCRSL
jgi:hypothetical protein